MAVTTTVAALLAGLAVTMGAVTPVAAATGSTSPSPQWSPLQSYSTVTVTGSTPSGPLTLASALACPSYGMCVAAGVTESTSSQLSAAVMLETGPGQWGQPATAPLPGNAASGGQPQFSSVACSGASSCVAVGSYTTTANGTQPFAVPFTISGGNVSFGTPIQVSLPGNALTTSAQVAFLSGVSCGAGGCTAVGTYETSGNVWTAVTATPGAGGSWTATAVSSPPAANNDTVLNAISCPSSGACEAVGSYGDGSNHSQLWAVQVSSGVAGSPQPVTIPNTGTTSANTPSPAGLFYLRGGLAAVSCPSAGVCTAAGTVPAPGSSLPEGVVLPISGGTPGSSTILTSNGLAAPAELQGIWCSDASNCMTVGLGLQLVATGELGQVVTAYESNGSWSDSSSLQGIAPPSGTTMSLAIAQSVACTSPGVCVSSGLSISQAGSTETEGSFFAYSALPPTVTTSSLPPATVGKPYSATLQSVGGSGTGSWAVSLGALPAGLALNASTGVISGTPTSVGQSGFAVTATNAGPPSLSSATTSLSITVGPVASVQVAYTKISGRSALVVLTCSGAPCAGTYKLTGIEHLKNGRPTAVVAKAKKKPARTRTVTLARGRYTLTRGASRAVTIKLNPTGTRLLRRLGRISCRLTLTPTGAKKPAVIKKLTFRSR